LVTLVFKTVLNAGSPNGHDFNEGNYPWEAVPAGHLMAADELAAAVFAEVILCAVVFFPFRDMLGLWQRWACDLYGY
jgi:hypothetical protein